MRSKFLSAAVATAFLPGTCTTLDGVMSMGGGPPLSGIVAPADEVLPLKSMRFLMQTEDPPLEDEPVDPPVGSEDST